MIRLLYMVYKLRSRVNMKLEKNKRGKRKFNCVEINDLMMPQKKIKKIGYGNQYAGTFESILA